MTTYESLQTVTEADVTSSSNAREMVSVVIPCYNEERFIGKTLEQLLNQYDPEYYEIVVVDGLSEDGTRRVIGEFKQKHPNIQVVIIDNPGRNIPSALNIGVAAARGSIIARMDAHAVPSAGYIRRCVEVMRQDHAGVVGMPCVVKPADDTMVASAIAGAVSHPFGIGDAKYRLRDSGPLQESVDTVAFACFRKALWAELGGFNESLLTNEDYEFNYRVRRAGWKVILDRTGYCDYFARGTLKSLAQQYWRYGKWKAQMIRREPASTKLRHLVAPAFVISILLFALAGLIWPLAWWLLLFEVSVYLLVSVFAGAQVAHRSKAGIALTFLMPVVFVTIHLTWGTSFLVGLFSRTNDGRVTVPAISSSTFD